MNNNSYDAALEHALIRARRAAWGERAPGEHALPVHHPLGLALSGGGIRSATFSLGLVQALAESKRLPQIDYLSTVSGGGYTGVLVGSLFLPRCADYTVPDPARVDAGSGAAAESPAQAAARAELLLTDAPHALHVDLPARAALMQRHELTSTTPAGHAPGGQTPASPAPASPPSASPAPANDVPNQDPFATHSSAARPPARNPSAPSSTDAPALAPVTIFHPLRWLRENGRYLTPSGAADLLFLTAFYLRALLGVHYVLAIALLGGVLAVYLLRLLLHGAAYVAFGDALPAAFDALGWLPALEAATPQLWRSPIVWLLPGLVLAIGGPLVLAYWLAFRQEKAGALTREERAIKLGPVLLLVISGAGALLLAGLDTWQNPVVFVLVYGAYLAAATRVLQKFWLEGLLRPGESWVQSGPIARVRLTLTQVLAALLRVLVVVFAAALVDTLGQNIFIYALRGDRAALTLATSGGVIALALALLQKIGRIWFVTDPRKGMKLVLRYRKPAALVVAVLALLAIAALLAALLQAILWSPLLAPSEDDISAQIDTLHFGLFGGTVLAWLLLAWLTRESLGFLNNSTFHRFYAGRLVRTFLGAANVKRLAEFHRAAQAPSGAHRLFVQESHPDDDVSLRSYYGAGSAAPLHLINCTLNETRSETSSLVREDRRGVALAVGPLGINVDMRFFPWADPVRGIGMRVVGPPQASTPALERRAAPPATEQAAAAPAAEHPAAELAATEQHASSIAAAVQGARPHDADDAEHSVERLPLGAWAAISGAAVGTGLGHMSSLGYSMLAWLVNARLGYWWLPAPLMSTQRRESPLRTFDLVLQEMSGGTYGQRGTRWLLSDGGHFENTGVYELLRRRAALIVCADNGADPDYAFHDLQNLVRRARIDFGAEIELLDTAAIRDFVTTWLGNDAVAGRLFGTLDELRTAAQRGDKCVTLARVRYQPSAAGSADSAPGLEQGAAQGSAQGSALGAALGSAPGIASASAGLLVLIKPVLASFAPIDVQLYARADPLFPQQPTADQFFDEAQWESYRKLGIETGRRVFACWDGFVAAARQMSAARETI
jgi:hypothetical protein